MRKPLIRDLGRARLMPLVAIAASALLVTLSLVAPIESAAASDPAPTPASTAPPTHKPLAMGAFSASSYAAAAARLPSALGAALKRDVGLTPTEYLADAAAAAQAVKVVASLKGAGVHVLGSKINGTKLTVNVASAADSATVTATGATAVVGTPVLPDYSDVKFHSVTAPTINTYGGQGYFFQQADQIGTTQGFRCSMGFSGYSVSSASPQFVTAGHCATIMSGPASLITQTAPTNNGGAATITPTVLGSFVSGQYGGGMDYGIVGEGASVVPQASLYTWGGGSGAPLASAALPITGQTAAVVGATLCKSGSTSGWTCGAITKVDTQNYVCADDDPDCTTTVNSIVATTCLLPGDSGGGAVIGQNAAGIDSGSTFPATSCANPGGNTYNSVFFPMVSTGTESVIGQQGANWRLLTAPIVVTPVVGGSVSAGASMTGTLSSPSPTSTVSLYLDGSTTVFATVSASSGSWTIPLTGVAQGTHSYSVSASIGWSPSTLVTGTFSEAVTAVPTVTSPVSGGTVYPTTVMTGTINAPLAGSTVLLYLDGSTTPYATVNASTGSWSIPLTGIAAGAHSYLVAAGIGALPGTRVPGNFIEAPLPPTQSHIDSIVGGVGSVSVAGWAVWPDRLSSSVTLAINVGSSWSAVTANTSNSDSGQPAGAGTNHGFSAVLPLAPGSYSVCVWANGSAGGAASNIGCQTVTVLSAPPTQSHIDSIVGGVGSVSVAGWAVWPDRLSSSVTLAINVGSSWSAVTANTSNSDSGQPAGAGTNHGFSAVLPLAPGSYSVCVWANGSAGGAASNIGCQTVTVLSAPPTQSHIDSIVGGVGSVSVAGWAVWPDRLSSSVTLAINVGSSWSAVTANTSNSDSGQPAGAGTNHGFSAVLPLAPGSYSVCVWANGSAGGAASNIGCQTVTVLSAPPTQSHIDSIVGGVGSVSVAGWAVWPDRLSSSVTLAINVGSSWSAVTANTSNSDSGQPAGAGTNHGFSAVLPLAPGSYSVCVWANGSAGGAASNIGCQTVTVLSAPPTQSHIDSIVGGVGSVSVAGWAVWPDRLSSSVTLAINVGSSWSAVTANTSNSDSGQPAGAGTNHGFSAVLPLAPGSYSVCVWANGSAGGAASNIGCQTVTVLSAPPTQSHIDSIVGGVGSVSVAGWAVWPDRLSSSVTLAINVGSSWSAVTANTSNSDSGQPAGAGTNHGFSAVLPLAPGSYSVCVWANGSAGGAASNIGCQTVTVRTSTS